MSGGGAPRAACGRWPGQSAIYGVGPVVARFAGLLLLPIYTRHLEPRARSRTSARSWRSWRSARRSRSSASSTRSSASPPSARATTRFAVARTAIAMCCVSGVVARARRGARHAGRGAALPRRGQRGALARGLRRHADLAALRADARASTASSSGRSGSSPSRSSTSPSRSCSASSGSCTSTAARSGSSPAPSPARWSRSLVVLWDRRTVLFGSIDRELVRPLLRFGLPFMPSRAGDLGAQPLQPHARRLARDAARSRASSWSARTSRRPSRCS